MTWRGFSSISSRFFHPFPKQKACSQANKKSAQLERLNIFELCDKYTDRSNNKYFVFTFKANGLAFVSGPDKITINATTGSNQTFTWKLNISQEHKERALKAQFGPWNGSYKFVNPIISFNQKLSGNTTVRKSPENRLSRRLYWVGDLKRGYYISFQLVNIQRNDAGDYGVKLRVDNYPRRPSTLQSWFTLKVEVKKVSSLPFKTIAKTLSCLQTSPSRTIIEVKVVIFPLKHLRALVFVVFILKFQYWSVMVSCYGYEIWRHK